MKNKGLFAVIGVYLTIMLLNVAFWGGIVYAAVHFIRKYW